MHLFKDGPVQRQVGSQVPVSKHPFPLNMNIVQKLLNQEYCIRADNFIQGPRTIEIVGRKCIVQINKRDISTCNGLVSNHCHR